MSFTHRDLVLRPLALPPLRRRPSGRMAAPGEGQIIPAAIAAAAKRPYGRARRGTNKPSRHCGGGQAAGWPRPARAVQRSMKLTVSIIDDKQNLRFGQESGAPFGLLNAARALSRISTRCGSISALIQPAGHRGGGRRRGGRRCCRCRAGAAKGWRRLQRG